LRIARIGRTSPTRRAARPGQAPEETMRRMLVAVLVAVGAVGPEALAAGPSVITTVPVGAAPTGIAVNPSAGRVFVANQNAVSVSVIDEGSNAVVATVPLSASAKALSGVAVNPVTDRVYVGTLNFVPDSITVLDGSSLAVVASIPVDDRPIGIAVNPATNKIYVANLNASTVTVIDGATNTVLKTLRGASNPLAVGVNPTTNRVYVTNRASNTVWVLDGATDAVVATIPFPAGSEPGFVDVDPGSGNVYVSNLSGSSVSIVDGATNAVATTVPVGPNPAGIAVNPAGDVLVAINGTGAIAALDRKTGATIASIPGASRPYGVAVDPGRGRAYVSDTVANAVVVIDDRADAIPPTTALALSPPPNASGWNAGPVTATLTAADDPGGSGVAQITYSATGAANVPSTAVPGATASFVDSAEGVTTVSFFATDASGNSEAPRTATIRIDETPPATAATPQAGTPTAGIPPAALNVTSITVNGAELGPITCFDTPGLVLGLASTDALSGVARLSWSLAGAQAGAGGVAGPNATVPVSAAGTTTLAFSATDLAGNAEASRSVEIFVAKNAPVACAATALPPGPPPHGTVTIQGTLTTTVNGFTRTVPFGATFTY
jgi:YVTN family beta-propeller protein